MRNIADLGAHLEGGGIRRTDGILRLVLALSTLALASFAANTGANATCAGVAMLCAGAHVLSRAPRATSLVSLALGVGVLYTGAAPRVLAAGLVLFSAARLALYLGGRGALSVHIHRLEALRRRALVATGLAAGKAEFSGLAGDFYETAGRARRALLDLGVRPRRAEAWRIAASHLAASLRALPLVGNALDSAIASIIRRLAP